MTLKLGIIGVSEGNGHPYSWSAIFNGYNPEVMEDCGYPVIPRYLEAQQWPEARIKNAKVTTIWTQDRSLSEHIALASRIDSIAETPNDMLEKVDALLLARDDAENHYGFAQPFLAAGKPIYIDKPIALSSFELERLYALQRYPGQIFTCSALRYSTELKLTEEDREEVGDICEIHAFTPKSWDKYAVHIIEPVIAMLPEGSEPELLQNCVASPKSVGSGNLAVSWTTGIRTCFSALGGATSNISIRVHGTKGWKDLVFTDSFGAFRAALQGFVDGITTQSARSPKEFNETVVKLIEAGRQ